MADVAQVGGKNASLGEMVSNLVRCRRPRARRLRDDRRRVPRVPRRERPVRPHPADRRGAGCRPTSRSWRGSARTCGTGSRSSRFPPQFERRHPRGVRDARRGRPAARVRSRGRCGPARPPRICRTRRSRGSRRPSSTSAASRTSSPPSAACSRRSTTTARSPTACTTASTTTTWRSRRACSGWCDRMSVPPACCSPSTPNPASTARSSSRARTGSARRSCRAP